MSDLSEIPPPLCLLGLKNGEERGKRGLLFSNCFRVFQALVSARWQSLFVMTSHNSHFSYCA